MDWSVDVNEELGTVAVTLRGQWELTGILEALESLWTEQVRTGILRALWDFRGVSAGGVPTVQLREVANRHLRDRPDLPESRAAVVVSRDLEFGMARMTEAFISEGPVDMQIFRDLSEASEWLTREDDPST